MTRQIVVHYHIFKNAGTTVDTIFKRALAPGAIGGIEGPHPWSTLDRPALMAFIEQNPGLRYITSHQARLPAPEMPGVEVYPILFLRHPIDRVGSVYEYERKLPPSDRSIGAPIARGRSLAGYVHWRLQEGNGSVIRNFQVIHLAGRMTDMRYAIANDEDYELACARVARLPFFGLVDQFEASFRLMARYVRDLGIHLTDNYTTENRSAARKTTLDERINDIRAELGDTLYNELIDKNVHDMNLYDEAKRLFGKRRMSAADEII